MRAIVISALFSLSLALTACTKNYYLPASLDNLLLKIDVPESPHPSWLSENCWYHVEKVTNSIRPEEPPYFVVDAYIFYSNNTWGGTWFTLFGSVDDQRVRDTLSIKINQILARTPIPNSGYSHPLVNDTFHIVKRDYVDFNTYHFRANTIITNSRDAGSTIGNFSRVIYSDQEKFIVDTVYRVLYMKVPRYYIGGNSFGTIHDPTTKKEGPYLPFPVKLPPYDKSDPVNYWHPFRKWKARLDSINAGLRPPEVYVPR